MPDLAYILQRIQERFPRTDPVLEAMLATDIIGTLIPDVCHHYPWWFLHGGAGIGGGSGFASAFPLDEEQLPDLPRPFGNWLDRGWLLVDEGVTDYIIGDTARPGDGDLDPTTWSSVLVNRVNTVRMYELDGNCQRFVDVVSPQIFRDRRQLGEEDVCMPCIATTVDEFVEGTKTSVLKLSPTPDKAYIAQVDFSLTVPPTISVGPGPLNITNIVIDEYPELVINLGMFLAAEYFNEQRLMVYYEQKVWGNPPKGSVSRNAQKGGLVGRMKRDDRIRQGRREKSLSYESGNPFTGNGNRQNRRQRSFYGRYYQ